MFSIAALICSGVHVRCACVTRAATPVVAGAAMDVPDIVAPPAPVPMPVETTLTPGAVTSGFTALS